MKLTQHFSLAEFVRSATAQKLGIDNSLNTPDKADQTIVRNLKALSENILEPLREYTCQPIVISSGYRCPELNKAVGGSSTSAHMSGFAFDLVPTNGQMRVFKRFCRNFLSDKAFDQLISEKENNSGMPRWMHVGYKHPDGIRQRRQYLSMIDGNYYPMTD